MKTKILNYYLPLTITIAGLVPTVLIMNIQWMCIYFFGIFGCFISFTFKHKTKQERLIIYFRMLASQSVFFYTFSIPFVYFKDNRSVWFYGFIICLVLFIFNIFGLYKLIKKPDDPVKDDDY